jgi:hypothetical protein
MSSSGSADIKRECEGAQCLPEQKKPADHGTFRSEYLDAYWFTSWTGALQIVETPGASNTTRAVLPLFGRNSATNSPRKSRLPKAPLGCKEPKPRPEPQGKGSVDRMIGFSSAAWNKNLPSPASSPEVAMSLLEGCSISLSCKPSSGARHVNWARLTHLNR